MLSYWKLEKTRPAQQYTTVRPCMDQILMTCDEVHGSIEEPQSIYKNYSQSYLSALAIVPELRRASSRYENRKATAETDLRENAALCEGEPPQTRIIFWREGPLEYTVPPLGECSRNPSVSCTTWRCCERLHLASLNFFLKSLSVCLPISWWVIYKHTCLHCAECSAYSLLPYSQKGQTPMPHPPCSSDLTLSYFFCFPRWKKSSKENVLLMWKRWNKKWQRH